MIGDTEYKMISCDDHLDLAYLPSDLWTSRLPAKLRDSAPRVVEHEGQEVWMCEDRVWGRWAGGRRTPQGPKANYNAFDRGGVTDEGRRPANAELRLADMDRDGVEAHVIFGPVTSMEITDRELRAYSVRAYNDWLIEYCSVAPERLLGVAILPPEDPVAARNEVYRLAEQGQLRQANLQVARVTPRLFDSAWEPLWSAFEETGLILSFHVVVFGTLPASMPEAGTTASGFALTKHIIGQFLEPFVDLFAWGVLERHPGLRLVMAESGLGWLPWIVQELDHRHWRLWEGREYWAERGGIDLEMKPSEIFKRQVYATFQEDLVAMSLLDYFGDGHVLWASDYPHPDSTWPNSRRIVDEQMAGLTPSVRRQLTRDNAVALYGL